MRNTPLSSMTREEFESIDLNATSSSSGDVQKFYKENPSLALPPKFMKHRRGELKAVVN